ncbi:hypothetical protein HDV05_001600 [Chytridiales sp. JEL 0842]|nr:hypothetical protein HDV05_001600 [Chytridiales sp. JEL 0842]
MMTATTIINDFKEPVTVAAPTFTTTTTLPSTTWSNFQQALTSNSLPAALECFHNEEGGVEPSVLCAPNMQEAKGLKAIDAFLRIYIGQREWVSITEEILSTASTPTTLINEGILTFVHDAPFDMVLPEVKPTHRRISLPLMTLVRFHPVSAKIVSIRYYWDQATVLKQMGLLPTSLFCKANGTETVLPVVGVRIADRLKEDQKELASLFNQGGAEVDSVSQSLKKANLETAPQRLFEEQKQSARRLSIQRAKKGSMGALLSPDLDDIEIVDIDERPIRSAPAPQPVKVEEPAHTPAASARPQPAPTAMSSILDHTTAAETAFRPSSRVLQRPGGISSNPINQDTASDSPVKSGKKVFAEKRNVSELSFTEEAPLPTSSSSRAPTPAPTTPLEENVIHTGRRMLSKNALSSQISFSSSTDEPQPAYHTSRKMSATASSQSSQISFGSETPLETGEVQQFSRRKGGNGTELVSHISFGTSQNGGFDEDAPIRGGLGAKRDRNAPFGAGKVEETEVGGGLGAKRDRNAESESGERVSAVRVLRPPGGGGSVVLG